MSQGLVINDWEPEYQEPLAPLAKCQTTQLATGPLEFSAEQRQLIRDTFASGASDEEFSALLEVSRARRLNPFLRQVYYVKRWDSSKRREVWAVQVSIDGMRAIAQRTGLYDGQDEPEFLTDNDGKLLGCKVRVYRKDWSRPAVGVAYMAEFVQTTKEGKVTQFWGKMPHVMISKVAESIALRKAFPEDTSGLYIPEEMGNGAIVGDTLRGAEVEAKLEPPAPREPPQQTATNEKDFAKAIADAKSLDELTQVAGEIAKCISKTDPRRPALIKAFTERKTALAKPMREPGDDSEVIEGEVA